MHSISRLLQVCSQNLGFNINNCWAVPSLFPGLMCARSHWRVLSLIHATTASAVLAVSTTCRPARASLPGRRLAANWRGSPQSMVG